eukprot:scaffold406813_cov31-Prasinocladus_malaysianus.AAC.1
MAAGCRSGRKEAAPHHLTDPLFLTPPEADVPAHVSQGQPPPVHCCTSTKMWPEPFCLAICISD